MSTNTMPAGCPCGGASYSTCCGLYITGAAIAPTAEKLMRSRYTAFTMRNEAYLRATWHPSTLPAEPLFGDDEKVQWLGLEVKSALRLRQRKVTSADQPDENNQDSVEFVARYKAHGRAHRLHEVSRFVRESDDGAGTGAGVPWRWFYLDGSFPE